MSDAKPYTMDRLDAVLSEWEQGGKPRFVSDDLRATVEALAAMTAERDALAAEALNVYKAYERAEAENAALQALSDEHAEDAAREKVAHLATIRRMERMGAALTAIVNAFDRQVAEYRRNDDAAIAEISEQVHGKRMDAARAALAPEEPS